TVLSGPELPGLTDVGICSGLGASVQACALVAAPVLGGASLFSLTVRGIPRRRGTRLSWLSPARFEPAPVALTGGRLGWWHRLRRRLAHRKRSGRRSHGHRRRRAGPVLALSVLRHSVTASEAPPSHGSKLFPHCRKIGRCSDWHRSNAIARPSMYELPPASANSQLTPTL